MKELWRLCTKHARPKWTFIGRTFTPTYGTTDYNVTNLYILPNRTSQSQTKSSFRQMSEFLAVYFHVNVPWKCVKEQVELWSNAAFVVGNMQKLLSEILLYI